MSASAERERLVLDHTYLCRRAARKFRRAGLDVRDLEQIAAIGLLKACDRFDRALGTPFEAYAWTAIVGELMHHVRDHERFVRIPRGLRSYERAYRAAYERLLLAYERTPTAGELATELGVALERVHEIERAQAASAWTSLEVTRPREATAHEAALEDRMLVAGALAGLRPMERRVILAVYGLGLTQSELAARFSLHPRRVSRLHRSALDAMRRCVAC